MSKSKSKKTSPTSSQKEEKTPIVTAPVKKAEPLGSAGSALLLIWEAMRTRTDLLVRQEDDLAQLVVQQSQIRAERLGVSLADYVRNIDQLVTDVLAELNK